MGVVVGAGGGARAVLGAGGAARPREPLAGAGGALPPLPEDLVWGRGGGAFWALVYGGVGGASLPRGYGTGGALDPLAWFCGVIGL